MKIIFMGTPDFAIPTLRGLYNEGFHIPLVITQLDRPRGRGKKVQYTPVKEASLDFGIEVYQPLDINSQESIEKIKDLEPDFIVVVAYGQILKKPILEIPKYGCFNVHASLLPKYRGAAPINWAIINGETKTGITIMKMDKGLDTGDMYQRESLDISSEDDSVSIHDKLANFGEKIIGKALYDIRDCLIDGEKQDGKSSTYAPMLDKALGRIDWTKDGDQINNLIRGLRPWPSAYTFYGDQMMKIHKSNVLDYVLPGQLGQIVGVDESGIYVKVKDKTLLLKEIQFPGKKSMEVKEYLKGNKIDLGIILS